ncbi:MAG TPA: MmcQ/YjbR family DNA-binding protein [Gaiellaceae bacterium]|nr:MmcQ/YjbR family DNA-binding protein [Gaiellaceae bacterium]
MVDWDTVRELALSLPEAEDSGEDRTAFRVRGKLFAWAARERDGGGLGIRVEREEKQLILDSNPEIYFSSPHYEDWPGVQVRLEAIDREELRERLEDAWLIQAPSQLANAYLAERGERSS